MRADQGTELLSDGHGPIDSLGLENPGVEFSFTQPNRLLELNQHVGGVIGIDAHDQQANRVGTYVHEGDVAGFAYVQRGIHAEGDRKGQSDDIKAATRQGLRGCLPRHGVGR